MHKSTHSISVLVFKVFFFPSFLFVGVFILHHLFSIPIAANTFSNYLPVFSLRMSVTEFIQTSIISLLGHAVEDIVEESGSDKFSTVKEMSVMGASPHVPGYTTGQEVLIFC